MPESFVYTKCLTDGMVNINQYTNNPTIAENKKWRLKHFAINQIG